MSMTMRFAVPACPLPIDCLQIPTTLTPVPPSIYHRSGTGGIATGNRASVARPAFRSRQFVQHDVIDLEV